MFKSKTEKIDEEKPDDFEKNVITTHPPEEDKISASEAHK